MKICSNCGTQNEDSFSKCVACGGDLPITGDEATILLDPMDAGGSSSGFTLKQDTTSYSQDAGSQNTYNQNAYGQDMYGQAAGNMQNAAYGAAPSQQYYGDGMNAQYQAQQGMPGGMPYNNQPAGNWNQPPQPVKANKKAIFIALAAITAIVVLAFVIIFKFGNKVKGGADSPEEVAEIFIEAMDERDVDKIESICPPFLDSGADDIEDSLDELDLYDTEFKFVGVTDKSECDIDEVEADIKDYYNVSVDIEAAYDLEVEYDLYMSYLGDTYEETESESMLVIKYKGKWFLYE